MEVVVGVLSSGMEAASVQAGGMERQKEELGEKKGGKERMEEEEVFLSYFFFR